MKGNSPKNPANQRCHPYQLDNAGWFFTVEAARSGFRRQNQGNWLNWGDGAVRRRQTGGTLALAG